jgi:hypothetical protein
MVGPGDLNLATDVLGHCRLLFVQLAGADHALLAEMEQLATGLDNMHLADGHPGADALKRGRLQYLRVEPGRLRQQQLADAGMSAANVLIRLEGREPDPLLTYERGLRASVERRGGAVHVRAGVAKERSYTSAAMTRFAYAPAYPPRPGAVTAFGVVTPQNKTAEWWAMDWMRRETLFLPRYDDGGRVLARGHALASAAAIPCVTRRLFHNAAGYGTGDGYDFIGYFEFAEADASMFDAVMAALRDQRDNPEWAYVREGPEWWGRRVAAPRELWPTTSAPVR